MKQRNKANLTLLILGMLVMSSSFIIQHYIALPDGMNGFIKGIAIGLLILSLVVFFKQRNRVTE